MVNKVEKIQKKSLGLKLRSVNETQLIAGDRGFVNVKILNKWLIRGEKKKVFLSKQYFLVLSLDDIFFFFFFTEAH